LFCQQECKIAAGAGRRPERGAQPLGAGFVGRGLPVFYT